MKKSIMKDQLGIETDIEKNTPTRELIEGGPLVIWETETDNYALCVGKIKIADYKTRDDAYDDAMSIVKEMPLLIPLISAIAQMIYQIKTESQN